MNVLVYFCVDVTGDRNMLKLLERHVEAGGHRHVIELDIGVRHRRYATRCR